MTTPLQSTSSRSRLRTAPLLARIRGWLGSLSLPESSVIALTALAVGLGAGLGAVVFRRLIEAVQYVAYDLLGGLMGNLNVARILLVPAIGGLVVGALVVRFAPEAKGHGVPEVMEAVALRGGRIRPRVALVKALASSICIGTGGSVGREGPIAQIGSALGSTVGQLLKLSDDRVRNLVACGAAGGIAATFNAPIAGSLFALEVILGQFHAVYFGAVVISAVVADVVAHLFEGDVRAFAVPQYALASPWELALYALLGFAAALISVAFSRLLYASEDLWERFRLPEVVKPALGGLLLGVLGLLTLGSDGFPHVFGVGYDTITQALFGELAVGATLGLLAAKLLATVLTLGAGGSGGVFAPSLFMGAMLGAAFGQAAGMLFPGITAPPGAYAMVGMAAFFSGAAHAPVTAILILFEMTGDYNIILPLMLATVTSTMASRLLSRESVYTMKLARRGVRLDQGRDIDVMQSITVGQVMTKGPDVVPLDMSIDELAKAFARTHHHGFAVVDDSGNLAGVVTLQDLERAVGVERPAASTVSDIATTGDLMVAYPEEPMWEALRRMGARDIGRLPVVEEKGSGRLVGIVRRSDIIRAYEQAIVGRAQQQHRLELLRLGRIDNTGFAQVEIPAESSACGQPVRDIVLPSECLIVSVRRGRKLLVARGTTALEAGDVVTVFAPGELLPKVRSDLAAPPKKEGTAD
jgi:CIC family chloride channel protein